MQLMHRLTRAQEGPHPPSAHDCCSKSLFVVFGAWPGGGCHRTRRRPRRVRARRGAARAARLARRRSGARRGGGGGARARADWTRPRARTVAAVAPRRRAAAGGPRRARRRLVSRGAAGGAVGCDGGAVCSGTALGGGRAALGRGDRARSTRPRRVRAHSRPRTASTGMQTPMDGRGRQRVSGAVDAFAVPHHRSGANCGMGSL